MPMAPLPLVAYLHLQTGRCTSVSFIDPTPLAVCHTARIQQHKVFAVDATRGGSRQDLARLVLRLQAAPSRQRARRTPRSLPHARQRRRSPARPFATQTGPGLYGKLIGDKGYVSQPLAEQLLADHGVQLIIRLRTNMRNRLLPLADKLLLRKRALIETIYDHLKNICQIEHTRHRSPVNFLVNLVCGLIAYCHSPKKPSLHLDPYPDLLALPAA
jgi:hypothetical protein